MHNSTKEAETKPYKCLSDEPEVTGPIEKIRRISGLKNLYCLPDIHNKSHLEAPTSIAAEVEDSLVSELVPPSLGCGMGVVLTPFDVSDLSEKKLDDFYKKIKGEVDYSHESAIKGFFLWLGIISRPKLEYDFDSGEMRRAAASGARAVLEKYGLPESTLEHVEFGGRSPGSEILEEQVLDSVIPRSGEIEGGRNIGYGFGGNHFLEVQYVEKITDEETARKWGIRKGQVLVSYHGGGGSLPFYIGRYFSNRKKYSKKENFIRLPAKIIFHFADLGRVSDFPKRWRYYFEKNPFQEISVSGEEGQRRLASVVAAQNYGYAYRLGMVRRIMDAMEKAFGRGGMSLLWDACHDSIYPDGKDRRRIIHQNGANRVSSGKPVFISGTAKTASYLGVGLRSGFCDHGAGVAEKKAEKENKSVIHPENFLTYVYDRDRRKKALRHMTGEGLKEVAREFESAGIIKPVALLRPVATLKE